MPSSFFFLINAVGKSPENHKQECKSVASYKSSIAAVVACSVNNVIRTVSDDSCSGGLGTRLQVMHERSRICRFAHVKLVTFELIKKKMLRFLLYLMRPGLRNNEFTYAITANGVCLH